RPPGELSERSHRRARAGDLEATPGAPRRDRRAAREAPRAAGSLAQVSGNSHLVSTIGRMKRLLGLLLITTTLAAIDVWTKLLLPTPDWALHQRSHIWFIGSCLLLVAALPLARLRSNFVTLAAGIFNGGVLGNLISASEHHLVVPNPILIVDRTNGTAFILA